MHLGYTRDFAWHNCSRLHEREDRVLRMLLSIVPLLTVLQDMLA